MLTTADGAQGGGGGLEDPERNPPSARATTTPTWDADGECCPARRKAQDCTATVFRTQNSSGTLPSAPFAVTDEVPDWNVLEGSVH